MPVTGHVNQGELMAVMGPSAAGKSTLFNALTYRNLGGLQAVGHRYANGMEMRSRSAMTAIVGYIPQFDLFIGTLTVKEHLTFLVTFKSIVRWWGFFFLWRVIGFLFLRRPT